MFAVSYHLPDVDLVVFNPKNSKVIAVLSSKVARCECACGAKTEKTLSLTEIEKYRKDRKFVKWLTANAWCNLDIIAQEPYKSSGSALRLLTLNLDKTYKSFRKNPKANILYSR
jgi:hypothetical protein